MLAVLRRFREEKTVEALSRYLQTEGRSKLRLTCQRWRYLEVVAIEFQMSGKVAHVCPRC
jgi:hypothetical protein